MGMMLKLKPNWVRSLTISFSGELSFISLAAKLRRCDTRIDNSINPFSAGALSCIRMFPRPFHSSASEDDDYSVLGYPVPKPLSSLRKLMTEKPEPYRKTIRTRKSSGTPSESSISLKEDTSKRESSRTASLAGEVVVKSVDLPSSPPDAQEAVTIRITNINSETTDSAVRSTCMSCGSLEGLVRTKEDAVDALFSAKDNLGIKRIIRKLNQTIMNDRKWSANLHPRESTPEVRSRQSDANSDLGLDISHHLADLRRQMTLKTVCIEDLEYLHNAMLHLESHPHTRSSIPKDSKKS